MQTVWHWQILPYTIGFGYSYYLSRGELFPLPKRKRVVFLTPSTLECDEIWKQGPSKHNIKMRSYQSRVGPLSNVTVDDHCKDRDMQEIPAEDWSDVPYL